MRLKSSSHMPRGGSQSHFMGGWLTFVRDDKSDDGPRERAATIDMSAYAHISPRMQLCQETSI
jgi:hypothetical protein